MDMTVFSAVLAAAFLHAGWNGLVRVRLDRLMSVSLIMFAAGAIAGLAIPFLPLPRPEAWSWCIASAVIHQGYNVFLARAYEAGEYGQIYPLARGSAPLLTALCAPFVVGEWLSPVALAGVLAIIGAIYLIAAGGIRRSSTASTSPTGLGYALLTAVFIASYSLVDGIGARASGNPHSYAAWLFFLDGLLVIAYLAWARGPSALPALRPYLGIGLIGGGMSLAAYWIVIWAMTKAPIALVAALRETSVLFAVLIAAFMLKERVSGTRIIASGLALGGLVLLRLG